MGKERQYDGIRPASGSSIEIDFYYAGARCRERIRLEPTPANLKRASQHRAAILDAIERGIFDYATTFPDSPRAPAIVKQEAKTLAVYLEAWLARKKPTLKASTYAGYVKVVNGHLIPGLGTEPVSTIKRARLREWVAGLEAGNKTIANVMSVLRAALQEAYEDELIDSNPAAGWTYRKAEPVKDDDIDPFSPDEQAAILASLDGQGRNLIQFAFWSGLRTSELVALDWTDIDWLQGVARIRRAITQASDAAENTKTKAGRRDVKLLGPALQALKEQKAFTYLAGKEVFQNPRLMTRWAGDQAIRKTLWIYALRRAGVRYRNPYQTRHTYASMMLSAGEHPMWVSQQMGHRDWTMIARVYGRWIPHADQSAGGKAEAIFAPADGQHLVSIARK